MLCELTLNESAELKQCEDIIERGYHAFQAVGNALAKIRDDKLYRATYGTFESYLLEKWGISRRHGYRLIEAAETANTLDLPDKIAESAVRILRTVPEADRPKVLALAQARNPVPTAADMQAAIDELLIEQIEQADANADENKRRAAATRAQIAADNERRLLLARKRDRTKEEEKELATLREEHAERMEEEAEKERERKEKIRDHLEAWPQRLVTEIDRAMAAKIRVGSYLETLFNKLRSVLAGRG